MCSIVGRAGKAETLSTVLVGKVRRRDVLGSHSSRDSIYPSSVYNFIVTIGLNFGENDAV